MSFFLPISSLHLWFDFSPFPPLVPPTSSPGYQTHLAVLCVQAPNVGTGPEAEVGMVALGLVDPLPAQVLAEVDVKLPHAAVLLCGAAGKERRNPGQENLDVQGWAMPLLPRRLFASLQISPLPPPPQGYILVSLGPPVIKNSNSRSANTDKALPLVKPYAKSIIINSISCSAQSKPVRNQVTIHRDG